MAWLLCLSGSFGATAQSHPTNIAVDESRSRIHSTTEVITPVLAIENPSAATTVQVQVELLDTTDAVRARGEVEAQLHPGLNQISVPLQGWTQKSDEWNDSIWYRVRYRVVPAQAGTAGAEGILALAAKGDGIFDVRVVASRRTVPGMPYRVRVYTQSLSTLQPLAGVQLSAELESDDDDAILKLASVTNARGYAQIEFKVPSGEGWGSSASLTVVARKGQVVRKATERVEFIARPRKWAASNRPRWTKWLAPCKSTWPSF